MGQTKGPLDLVDYDLFVAEVLFVFGRYVKYNVEREAASEPPQVATVCTHHTCTKCLMNYIPLNI